MSEGQRTAERESRARSRVPWVSILTWTGAFLLLYALHDVFAIAFIAFLLVYLVRALVVPVAHRISPGEERPWLERGLTLATFAAIVVLLWGLGSLVGTHLIQQGRLLIADVEHLQPDDLLDKLLARTVGAYLFEKSYGDQDDPRYQAAFARFKAEGRAGEGAFAAFGALQAQVQAGFEIAYETAQRARLERQIKGKGADSPAFERWVLRQGAAEPVGEQGGTDSERPAGAAPSPSGAGGEPRRHLDTQALQVLDSRPEERSRLIAEWEQAQVAARWRELHASPEYADAFKRWFESPEGRALKVPYDLDLYLALREAYREGAAAFGQVFNQRVSETPGGRVLIRLDFRRATESELARQWWASSPVAASLREHLEKDASEVAAAAAGYVQSSVRGLIAIPTEVGIALLLTILISFDMIGLKQGVSRLRESRFAEVYAEAVPNLVAMARLIGRAFAAQGVVALFNAILTFLMLRLLGIDNELLLTLIVLIASLIPVLGVILSAVPITLQALLQPDGSLAMAFYALVGIGVIHGIETTVLSPKIVGRLLHLHPVLVVVVLVIGEHLFGVWGLLLGVPVAVYAIHVGVMAEPIPGIDQPGSAPQASAVAK